MCKYKMNAMFGKSFEPISQSERIKNKRNKTIFKAVSSSNDICLDKNGNIKNAKNYESFMNTVNGYYECKKEDVSNNKDCFNTYLDDKTDEFSISTFEDVQSNFVDFQMYDDDDTNRSAIGRKKIKSNFDGTNTTFAAADSEDRGSNIVTAANVVYPFKKPGLCSKYVIQDVSYFDPSGNFNSKFAKDIKKYFPLTKLN